MEQASPPPPDDILDLQVNGYAGVDFNNVATTPDEMREACRRLREDGVSRILATIITDDVESMAARLTVGADLVMLVLGVVPVLVAGVFAARTAGGPLAWIEWVVGGVIGVTIATGVLRTARGQKLSQELLETLLVCAALAIGVGLLTAALGACSGRPAASAPSSPRSLPSTSPSCPRPSTPSATSWASRRWRSVASGVVRTPVSVPSSCVVSPAARSAMPCRTASATTGGSSAYFAGSSTTLASIGPSSGSEDAASGGRYCRIAPERPTVIAVPPTTPTARYSFPFPRCAIRHSCWRRLPGRCHCLTLIAWSRRLRSGSSCW